MANTKTIGGTTYIRVPVGERDAFFRNYQQATSNIYFSISDADEVTELGDYIDTYGGNYLYRRNNQMVADSMNNLNLYYISKNGTTGGKRRRKSNKRRNSRKRRSYRRR